MCIYSIYITLYNKTVGRRGTNINIYIYTLLLLKYLYIYIYIHTYILFYLSTQYEDKDIKSSCGVRSTEQATLYSFMLYWVDK